MEILHSVPYTSRVNRVMHIGKTGKKKKKCCRISNTQRLINCLFCICFSMYTLSLDLVLFFSCECRIQCEPQSDLSSCCSDVLWISSATFDTPVSFAFNYFGSEPARDRVNRFPPPPLSYVQSPSTCITNGKRETQLEIRVSLQSSDSVAFLWKIVHCKCMGRNNNKAIRNQVVVWTFSLCNMCGRGACTHIFMACSATVLYLHLSVFSPWKRCWVGVGKILAYRATS